MTTQPFEFNEIEKQILSILENYANLIKNFNNLNKKNQPLAKIQINDQKTQMIKLINSLTNYNIMFLKMCNLVQIAICGSCHLDFDKDLSRNILNKTYNKFLNRYKKLEWPKPHEQKKFDYQLKSELTNVLNVLLLHCNQIFCNPNYVINVGIIKECSDILNDKHKALTHLFH
jgi:hypothetical protein